jgi:large subunit ribosomal protein L29
VKSKNFLNDIKAMSEADLANKKVALKEELMKLRFKGAAGQLEKAHVVSEIRKNIARVETVLTAKRGSSKKAK